MTEPVDQSLTGEIIACLKDLEELLTEFQEEAKDRYPKRASDLADSLVSDAEDLCLVLTAAKGASKK